MPRGAVGLVVPEEPEFEARITRTLNAVERFWLIEHGVQVLDAPNSVRLIFPNSTLKLASRHKVTDYCGIETSVVTSVPYVLQSGAEVWCVAVEEERGLPTFETLIEVHSEDWDRYRLLTQPVTGETLAALQREGVRVVDLADHPMGGQIIVFPEGSSRRTALPEYTISDGMGPDLSVPGSFMRSLEISLPSYRVCVLHEVLARSEAGIGDSLEYESSLDIDWEVEGDAGGEDEANHRF